MILYNSLGQTKQEFVPFSDKIVNMYTCGPTVYHYAHIGNLRTYIMEDVLEKYLRYSGYDVTRVMNITDVGHLTSDADTGDDKMLEGAKREHKSVMEIAKFYTDAFFEDCKKLNIKTPDVVEPATKCIDEFIKMDPKMGGRLKHNGATFLVITTIRSSSCEIGYFGFIYYDNNFEQNFGQQESMEIILHSVQKLSNLLDKEIKI